MEERASFARVKSHSTAVGTFEGAFPDPWIPITPEDSDKDPHLDKRWEDDDDEFTLVTSFGAVIR